MIYTINNTALVGKPVRVFVNGNEIRHATYADTVKGVVHFYPQPTRLKKLGRDQIYSRKLRGKVTVEFTEE